MFECEKCGREVDYIERDEDGVCGVGVDAAVCNRCLTYAQMLEEQDDEREHNSLYDADDFLDD